MIKFDTANIKNFDSNLDLALVDIREMRWKHGNEFDFEIVGLFDGFVVNEFFNAIFNTFLKDVMKQDSMFYSAFNGEYAVNNIKGFIVDLFAALNRNIDECQMEAFIRTKVFGGNKQFNFKFYLPKTIMTDEKFDNFLHMGPDYILGQLAPIQIMQYVLPPLYIALAEANALDKDELKNFGSYQMGLN
jgi:hypothetical protein